MKLSEPYPTVSAVMAGTNFEASWGSAMEVADKQGEEAFWHLTRKRTLNTNCLTYFLASPIVTHFKDTAAAATNLEHDLARLVAAFGVDTVRGAYRKKLLVDAQFEDVLHEISVGSILLDIIDHGSLRLEAPIAGTKKNSDFAGTLVGITVRIEATGLHEEWPPHPPFEVQEFMESIDLPLGYSAGLRYPVLHEADAKVVVEQIREIYDRRQEITKSGSKLSFGTAWLEEEEEYSFITDKGPIDRISFHDDPALRLVVQPAHSRSTMEKSERDQIENPKGVITLADVTLSDPTHIDRALSTKIWQAIDNKRGQCAPGELLTVT